MSGVFFSEMRMNKRQVAVTSSQAAEHSVQADLQRRLREIEHKLQCASPAPGQRTSILWGELEWAPVDQHTVKVGLSALVLLTNPCDAQVGDYVTYDSMLKYMPRPTMFPSFEFISTPSVPAWPFREESPLPLYFPRHYRAFEPAKFRYRGDTIEVWRCTHAS
jgi:hypothetical protein